MLVPTRVILAAADKYQYGQGAFNVNAVAQAKAVIEAHQRLRSPAILQGADLANGFMGGRTDFIHSTLDDKKIGAKNIAAAVKKYARHSPFPIALHLDHGKDLDSCIAAIKGGYTGVMIDGSSLCFDDNVDLTREVVRYAHRYGVSVEGELGVLAGVEDDVSSGYSTYTNPVKAIEFFKKTGVDALAISYGTMHGANKGKHTVIRKEIAISIKESMRHESINGFLVSHGSSTVPTYIVEELNALGGNIYNAYGIDLRQLVEVSRCGINKINVDTDIRLAIVRNIRELFAKEILLRKSTSVGTIYQLLQEMPQVFDPRVFLTPIMESVMYGTGVDTDIAQILQCVENGVHEIVSPLIAHFGSVGMAPKVEQVSLEEMARRYKEGIV